MNIYRYTVVKLICAALFSIIVSKVCADTLTNTANAADIWLRDIDALDMLLRQHHPDPFFRTGEGAWLDGLATARKLIRNGASDAAISTQLMSTVAHLKDGHTRLEPVKIDAFASWLPLRFYKFDEGVHVTVATDQNADLIGKRVISVSGSLIEDVWTKVALATAGDNVFQVMEGAAALLSNAGLLAATGVIENPIEPITLVFEDNEGTQVTRTIPIINSWYSVNFRNWGELFGPPFDPFDIYKTPFHDEKTPLAYRDPPNATDAPYYASRKPFWARLNNKETVLTFQFNFFADIGDIGWDDFRNQMWKMLDQARPDRFVIDLRYNFGGDGRMVRAFINELLARPEYANNSRLVVLTGRQTFSAAIILVAALKDHTDAIFVGEPAGAPLNQYGDPTSLSLPSGRLELAVSTLYWQLGHPSNRVNTIPVNKCVATKAKDYFAGRDIAWNTAASLEISKYRSDLHICN
ncbi:MAG: hypothetical protein GKR93_20015 [Gammaproteobacteria bacterium]|nr:hypothetical protein [Gammaproteobacteria bacterium]